MFDAKRGAVRERWESASRRTIWLLDSDALLFLAGITAGVGASLFSDRLLLDPPQRLLAMFDLALFSVVTYLLMAARRVRDEIQRDRDKDSGGRGEDFVGDDQRQQALRYLVPVVLLLAAAVVLLLVGW